jgi:hypothetical protein
MTPQELYDIDKQVDEIMNNIMEDDNLSIIRDALTLYLQGETNEKLNG